VQQVILSGVLYTQLLEDLRALVRGEVQSTLSAPASKEPEAEQLLTVREAAAMLDVCLQTVHEWKRKGLLCYYKIGGRTYLKRHEVLAALQGQRRSVKKGCPS
jgi:excisionase family DNA binding protein